MAISSGSSSGGGAEAAANAAACASVPAAGTAEMGAPTRIAIWTGTVQTASPEASGCGSAETLPVATPCGTGGALAIAGAELEQLVA